MSAEVVVNYRTDELTPCDSCQNMNSLLEIVMSVIHGMYFVTIASYAEADSEWMISMNNMKTARNSLRNPQTPNLQGNKW